MQIFSENTQIGDYIILQCLREHEETRTWLAKQVSVGRTVLIDELKQTHSTHSQAFLADVRAKAAVEHPLVGSIYEASTDRGLCFCAYELLPGDTVTQLAQSQESFKAQRFVHLLRRIAEANIYHETHQNATSPLGPDDIHIDTQGIIRLENLVIHGERNEDQSLRDIIHLGSFFQSVLDPNHPGTTRCLTLLAWMRGEDTEHYLSWAKIRDYCEQIEQQLTEPSEIQALPTTAIPAEQKSYLMWVWIALGVLLLGGVITFAITRTKNGSSIAETKPAWIEVPAGSYSTMNGFDFTVVAFSISNQEVSIGEYSKFIKTLDLLAKESNDHVFNHPDQPKSKTSHKPNHWDDLYDSALKSKPWNNIKINLNTPVVGVDWWDAYAYAKWKKCALPTQEQWLAALVSQSKDYSTIPVSAWPPANETPDRTTNGILAMAGSVAEWTAEPRVSPSNPLGKPQWVVIGGSYRKPGKGSLSQEWIEDRSTRRDDLGFRICQPN
jgi:formylglycine-generating enzyme required for sulfatase activity